MTEGLYSAKIKPEHLARKAIVYLRQSSERQVRQNKESQQLQYAVAERVRALGWKQVEIINSDLGSSAGIASAQREGFERVLSLVALGEVGIVGSRELSRLSRTDKDWCRLLEVCQIFGTLIADEQQVYDLNYLDDQLVLGIKGTLSVVELKVMRQRLLAGQESKARRGELFKRLPIGYARDPVGKIVFHPDRRICEAIQLVFAKFRELWSVRQTFQWFRDHDVELPANPIQGTRLVWKIPSQSLIRDILCNPFYAGAYVWGRRPVTTLLVDGRLEKRQSAMRPAEECRVFMRDHHVGYIHWATYEENRRMMRRNSVKWEGDEALEEIEAVKQRLSSLDAQRYSLSPEEEIRIRSMGDHFAQVWQSDHCPPTLKKMIFRTAIEEIIVRTDQDKKSLELVIHWKGGAHTQLAMERPRSATETATPVEALEIIRRMAVRYGDDQIASVLNRRGYSTGKGMRWNQIRVATARRNHSIAGQKRALPDPERVSLSQAARICGVSHHTIQRLVEAGLLKREQVTPRAPWEIRRTDLDAEPIRGIIDRLHRTGKLILQGGCAEDQLALFIENAGDDNARHHE